ncbi:hypothetical protein [Haloarcula argentinensis]|uniref:Uncharacterized protein n=1 Tax=Haloarcula argentinensis TaxID=43776 RepID=A0A830FVF3_HALAR|nr:hypothetical protein [Haloarcula argentinensis]GGM46232.1 hypothetical protein GCM10009006_29380 [Haloarcula argentinensis]
MAASEETDSSQPADPSTVAELEALPYSEKQRLAGDHGYGRIVGVEEAELENFLTDTLALSESENVDSGNDSEPEGGTQTVTNSESTSASTETQTDAISVGHEGKEKLSPEGAPDDEGTAVEPPSGVDLDGLSPDDLEPNGSAPPANQSESSEHAEKPEQQEQSDSSENSEDSGGLLDRIRGNSDRSTDEIVADADSETERQRREEVRETFADSFGEDSAESGDSAQEQPNSSGDPSPAGTQQASGMVVDETVVQHLIGMPFSMTATMTDWEGWELSEQEKAANAELFIAMCDEHDVDVGPTAMFALSMLGTAGGRAMRYRRQQDTDPAETDRKQSEKSPEFNDDVTTVRGQDGRRNRRDTRTEHSEEQSENSAESAFDFEDSSTW